MLRRKLRKACIRSCKDCVLHQAVVSTQTILDCIFSVSFKNKQKKLKTKNTKANQPKKFQRVFLCHWNPLPVFWFCPCSAVIWFCCTSFWSGLPGCSILLWTLMLMTVLLILFFFQHNAWYFLKTIGMGNSESNWVPTFHIHGVLCVFIFIFFGVICFWGGEDATKHSFSSLSAALLSIVMSLICRGCWECTGS